MKRLFFPVMAVAVFAVAFVFLSCVTSGRPTNILPLADGWYQYDFVRTFKGIEDEYNFAVSTGMTMRQELTWVYTGVVTRFDDGALFDPVTGIELLIDNQGQISSAGNISIRGVVNNDGSFYWGGLREEHGRLNSIFVRGNLTPLPSSARGGGEFDGVYQMTDSGTGRRQLVKIQDGFYTWNYIDGQETGFTPWPTLVRPDGTFSFGMDMTTIMEMGEHARSNFSTGFLSKGRVIPGQGIFMEETTITAGQGIDQSNPPQTFSGTEIRSGMFPNEAIPANIESLIQAGRTTARTAPRPNRARYPAWYLNLPSRPGYIFAAGEKTFDVKETALAMAEAAAAANLANQIMVQIQSSMVEVSNNAGTMIDERIRSEALQRVNYRIIEQVYDAQSRTAFVLLEMQRN